MTGNMESWPPYPIVDRSPTASELDCWDYKSGRITYDEMINRWYERIHKEQLARPRLLSRSL